MNLEDWLAISLLAFVALIGAIAAVDFVYAAGVVPW